MKNENIINISDIRVLRERRQKVSKSEYKRKLTLLINELRKLNSERKMHCVKVKYDGKK